MSLKKNRSSQPARTHLPPREPLEPFCMSLRACGAVRPGSARYFRPSCGPDPGSSPHPIASPGGVESARGISPPASLRRAREPLDSHRSHQASAPKPFSLKA